MIGLMYAIGWGSLKLLTLILVIFFLSRPWHIGERIACTAMTLMIGFGIPYWDYIPAKMYFSEMCKVAGVKTVLNKKYSDPYYGVTSKHHVSNYDWNIRKIQTQYYDKNSGDLVVEHTVLIQNDGHNGFIKPWMRGECPAVGIENAVANPNSDNRLKFGDMPSAVYNQLKEK